MLVDPHLLCPPKTQNGVESLVYQKTNFQYFNSTLKQKNKENIKKPARDFHRGP
jgi:hypothetical protein